MSLLIRRWSVALLAVVLPVLGGSSAVAQSSIDTLFSTDETFPTATMHRPFILEAPAVVRLDVRRFVVEGAGAATEHVRRVVTILNPDGKDHARLVLPYDKFRRIDRLEGRVRDVRGNVVRKLGKDDQRDFSAISGYTLYEERRVRVAELYESNYPYTVEFTYTIEHDGLISWPTWRAQERELPVEYAAFEVDAPAHVPIRYVVENGSWAPEKERADGRHRVRWTDAQVEKGQSVAYGPPWRDQVVTVHTAPTAFEIEGASGRMDDWAAFGQWYHRLSQGRGTLSPATRAKVDTLTAAAGDTLEAIEALYRFMQDRTRYVNVSLGIGGWQPFPARYVETRGYGDCKALTNYMQALLTAAGIESFPVLIRAGHDAPAILPDFPSNQFNHVVLAVPLDGDTLWLENTDQTAPFGHVSSSIEDRHALLVTPEGGRLIRTPRSAASDNTQHRRAHVELKADGDAQARIHTTFAGNQQDRVRGALALRSQRDRAEWLRDAIDIPNFSVTAADFSDVDRRQRIIALPVELSLSRYGARTGRRLFFRPNLMQRWTSVPPSADTARTVPVHVADYPFVDTDSIAYALPEGYAVEAAPEPVRLATPFAYYEARVETPSDGKLVYRRRMEMREETLRAEQYGVLRTFLRQVARADRQQVVLVQR